MKKILVLLPSLACGDGIANFYMEYYKTLIKTYEIDFFCLIDNISDDNRKEINGNGGKIFVAPNYNRINIYWKLKKCIKSILKDNNYDLVHNNLVCTPSMICTIEIKRTKKIIVNHSHNPVINDKRPLFYIHKIQNNIAIKLSDYKFACSKTAGKSSFKKNSFIVIPNIKKIEKYKFDLNNRNEIRKKYNIDDKIVIGVVARYTNQKNPEFIIKIFKEIILLNNNFKLIWIGNGELEKYVTNLLKKYNIEEDVILTGEIDNVYKYYSAMDYYMLPSKFEGFGFCFIEAQASGLPTFASDVVPEETNVSDLINYLSLDEKPIIWAEKILKTNIKNQKERKQYNEQIKNIINKEYKLLYEYNNILNERNKYE